MITRIKKVIFLGVLFGSCMAICNAAVRERPQILLFKVAEGNWDDPKSWKNGSVPQSNNYAYLMGTNSATINSKIPNVGAIALGGENKTSTLSICEGAQVAVEGVIFVPSLSRKNTGGCLNMTGGTVNTGIAPDAPRGIYIGAGSTYSGQGMATISAGTYNGGFKIGSHLPETQTGTLAIVGSRPKIVSPDERHRLTVNQSGTLLFVCDEDGVAALDYSKSSAAFQKGAQVIVDGANYNGGPKTLYLLRANRLRDDGVVLHVRGFPENCRAELSCNKGKGGNITLKIVSGKR